MNRRRRLAIVAATVVASFAGPVVAASAAPSLSGARENDHGDWWCIVLGDANVGYCQGNPLPERLPLPEDRPKL